MPNIPPANSGRRQDWRFLSKVLGQDAVTIPPADPKKAEDKLRSMVRQAVETSESYDALMRMALHEVILAEVKRCPRYDYEELLSFLKSRLWNRRPDGQKTASRLGRAHSSNDIVSAWNPAKAGFIPYLRINATRIIRRDWVKETNFARPLAAPMGMGSSFGDEDGLVAAMAEAGSSLQWRRGAPRRQELDFARDSAIREQERSAEVARHGAEWTRLARYAVSSAGMSGDVLRSEYNPDYLLLAEGIGLASIPEPELDWEARMEQLRDLAREFVALHAPDRASAEALTEDVATWDPSKETFAQRYPGMCVEAHETFLDLGLETHTQTDFAQGLIFARLSPGGEPSNALSPRANRLLQEVPGWYARETCRPEDLLSVEREDYVGLCALNDCEPDFSLEPEQMGKAMKGLVERLVPQVIASVDNLQFARENDLVEALRAMSEWEPLKDGYFGECLLESYRLAREKRLVVARQKKMATPSAKIELAIDPPSQGALFAEFPEVAPIPKLRSVSGCGAAVTL